MYRMIALLLTLIMLLSAAAYASAEDVPAVYSCDFEIRFSLNADVFPARTRAHMQGYAELLNALELKGNYTWCPEYESGDLNVEIVPVSRPDASVCFRLYGIPSDLSLTSPLLGNETVWFDNYSLMEFGLKTWNNMHFPLQYVALLYPYSTTNAFKGLAAVWNKQVGPVTKSSTVSAKALKRVAERWADKQESDSRLNYWILAISSVASDNGAMELEFANLPDYLLNQVSHGKKLKVTFRGSTETWTNSSNETLYTCTKGDGSTSWTLSLPETANGYVPFMTVSSVSSDECFSLSAEGSYNRSSTGDADSVSSLPDSLLDFSLHLDNWPKKVSDSEFTGDVMISGALLPNLNLRMTGTITETGRLSVVIDYPVTQGGESRSVLTITGTVTPVAASSVPRYTDKEMHKFLRIFSVNDQNMNDFVQKITRPLFFGVLDFLDALPARGCQSLMDDLENYGVLDMMLPE